MRALASMISRSRTRDEARPILRCVEERGKKAFCIADILGGYETCTISRARWMLPAHMVGIGRQMFSRMAQAGVRAHQIDQSLQMLARCFTAPLKTWRRDR